MDKPIRKFENHESGYSEASEHESCSEKDSDKDFLDGYKEYDRDNSILYAATRIYAAKEKVRIISVEDIKNFDAGNTKYPFDAFVANGYNSDDEIIYEPATILGVSKSKTELESRKKRWPKPNKRKSDVLRELAKKDLERQNIQKKQKTQQQTRKKKNMLKEKEPSGIDEAKQQSREKILALNAKELNFDSGDLPAATKSRSTEQEEAEDKDSIIARLMQQLQEERQKNRVTSVSPSAAINSKDNNCNDATISPVLSNVNSRSSKSRRTNFVAASVPTPTGSRVMISGEGESGKENPPTSPETESPSLISAKPQIRKLTMMKTPTKRKRNDSVDVRFSIDEVSDALTVTPLSSLQKKLSPRQVNSVDEQIAGPSGVNDSVVTAAGKYNSTTSPETESPSLISANTRSRKLTMMRTPTKRKRNDSVDVRSSIDETSDALAVTPSSSLQKKLSPRRVNLVDEQIAGPSGVNAQSLQNKKQKKRKYERKMKECQYDSDDYNSSDLPKRKSFTKWDHEEINPDGFLAKTAMFHIHYGVSVPYKSWKRAITSESSYGFLRELVVPHIWSREEFVKRAIQVTRTHDSSNRLELSPRKRESLKRGYVQYLIERRIIPFKVSTEAEQKKRDSRINKFGRQLGIIISQERSKFYNELDADKTDDDDDATD